MREVHWNKLARSDYYQNIAVDDIEFILKQGKVEFQDTDVKDVKRCVICKQISLFYKVIDKHNVI